MRRPDIAGWSSLVARRAHNPEVVGSNPAPATKNLQLVGLAGELFFYPDVTKGQSLCHIPRRQLIWDRVFLTAPSTCFYLLSAEFNRGSMLPGHIL